MDMFKSYDSFDAMLEDMHQAEDAANERITEDQKAIGYGDYWVRKVDVGMGEYLTIYGRCWTRDEIVKGEKEAGAPDDELAYTMNVLDNAHARGYRFSTAYSQWEPEGEIGDVHISAMTQITEGAFEKAKSAGWPS